MPGLRLELAPPRRRRPVHTRKRWVRDLLAKREQTEKAIGMPLGELLGCGHYGCVFESSAPWVIKLSVDPTEGPIWNTIASAIEDNAGYGADGFVRLKDVLRLKPDVGEGRKKRPLYAVIREEVEPAFRLGEEGDAVTTQYTLERLGIADPQIDQQEELPAWTWDATRPEQWDTSDARDFARAIRGLQAYRRVGRDKQALDTFRSSRNRQSHLRQADYLRSVGLWTYDPIEQLSFGSHAGRPKPDADDILLDRASRATDWLGGAVGGALGESLSTLAGSGIILRDVHLLNIGWRVHECIEDSCAHMGLVIFDPGHTPTERVGEIEERFIQNARWGG